MSASARFCSASSPLHLHHGTRQLLSRMLSPLVGFDQRIGFSLRGPREPRFATAGAELTGVHVLRGREAPPSGFYHIGGGGVFVQEAIIRSLGESVERYSQFVSEISQRHPVTMASYEAMAERGEPILSDSKLRFFSEEQLSLEGFPFRAFDPQATMGWVQVRSLLGEERVWVPAQQLMVGYMPKVHDGEHWLLSSVTTGTAAHTKPMKAVVNALSEIAQIDAAMGHWYTARKARRIELGIRGRAIERIVYRRFCRHEPRPQFYLLPSADLPGFAIACVIRGEEEQWPAAAVGLGSDLSLSGALYKALLEGVGVLQLTKWEMMKLESDGGSVESIDTDRIFDLDTNVALYAHQSWRDVIDAKFVDDEPIPAEDLAPDGPEDPAEQVAELLKAFGESGKELYFMNLTTSDIAELGFVAVRAWSPDTLSLCLPSAPPVLHRRFEAYGGSDWTHPHPYP